MPIHLTDGELEVLSELGADAAPWGGCEAGCEECAAADVEWCAGCRCPVGDCDCRALPPRGRTPLERALNKAMAAGTTPLRLDARTYAVPSASDSDRRASYAVTRRPGGGWACACPAGRRGRVCYHAAAVGMAAATELLTEAERRERSVHASLARGSSSLFA